MNYQTKQDCKKTAYRARPKQSCTVYFSQSLAAEHAKRTKNKVFTIPQNHKAQMKKAILVSKLEPIISPKNFDIW